MANTRSDYHSRYYRKNREKRLAYQNAYYRRTRERKRRERELMEVLEPETLEAKKEAYRNYQREYFRKNREKVLAQRARKKAKVMRTHN